MQLVFKPFGRGLRQRSLVTGVSLIEVLIAIVIASIGLLALAGVNTSAIRYSKMSQYRGTATLLANDIGERMRANKAGGADYAVAVDFSTQATLPTAPTTPCTSYLATCSAAQIAIEDIYSWRTRVREQLPEGSVYVQHQSVQNAYDVWVVWRDPSVSTGDLDATSAECPGGLTVASDTSIRCSYFRINV